MSTRATRARVHAGNLELLEELALPDGMELVVTITIPDNETQPVQATELETWDLGPMPPLSRAESMKTSSDSRPFFSI